MRRRIHFVEVALLLVLVAGCTEAAGQSALVITNATLIDGTGAPPRTSASIVVRDGVVVSVLDAGEAVIPDDARVVDATGRYVMPGLTDMHVHFGTGGLLPQEPGTVSRVLRQFLYYGVTTVLNLGATDGSPAAIAEVHRLQEEGRLIGPHVYATGGLVTVPGSHPIGTIMSPPDGADPAAYDWSTRGVWVVDTSDAMRDVVARLAASGVDGIKIVVESGPAPFGDDHARMDADMITAAVDAAAEYGLPVFAHATSPAELADVVAAGVTAVVHLVNEPEPPSDAMLAEMAERGVFLIPTLSIYLRPGSWGDPDVVLRDPFLRAGVEERVITGLLQSDFAPKEQPNAADSLRRTSTLRALRAVHDAGIRVVGGSDTANPFVFPGYSMHRELELMVAAGLSPMEAIIAATRRGAELLSAQDTFGTIAPGQRADLLILARNPLEDIRNTRTLEVVIRGGQVIDRAALLTADRDSRNEQ